MSDKIDINVYELVGVSEKEKEQIKEDIKKALRNKDSEYVEVLVENLTRKMSVAEKMAFIKGMIIGIVSAG